MLTNSMNYLDKLEEMYAIEQFNKDPLWKLEIKSKSTDMTTINLLTEMALKTESMTLKETLDMLMNKKFSLTEEPKLGEPNSLNYIAKKPKKHPFRLYLTFDGKSTEASLWLLKKETSVQLNNTSTWGETVTKLDQNDLQKQDKAFICQLDLAISRMELSYEPK